MRMFVQLWDLNPTTTTDLFSGKKKTKRGSSPPPACLFPASTARWIPSQIPAHDSREAVCSAIISSSLRVLIRSVDVYNKLTKGAPQEAGATPGVAQWGRQLTSLRTAGTAAVDRTTRSFPPPCLRPACCQTRQMEQHSSVLKSC